MRSFSPTAGAAPLIAFVAGALSVLALAPFNAWPVLFVTFPVLVWLVDGSADAGRPRLLGRGGRRLVLRLRLFRRRALLDRLRLPGRCQDLRLAAADRGLGPARLSRALHRARPRRCASALGARTVTHPRAGGRAHRGGMAARPSAHRLSLEHLRLCADRAAGAGAEHLAGRHLGTDVPERGDLRHPGDARRRPQGHAASLSPARHGADGARGDGRLRHRAACRTPDDFCERREAAHHAARSAAGRKVQLQRQGRGDAALPAHLRTAPPARTPRACTTSRI